VSPPIPSTATRGSTQGLEDPAWGEASLPLPSAGHTLSNPALEARALADGVYLEGGAINGIAVGDEILRTSEATLIRCGTAQVRRQVSGASMHLLHVLFAPRVERPLLLSLVRFANTGSELFSLDYTELWELPCQDAHEEVGAHVARLPAGERALAEVSSAVRARVPEPPPRFGLALTLRLTLPPGSQRQVGFAYVAPSGEEPAAPMVRAWRGDVEASLRALAGG